MSNYIDKRFSTLYRVNHFEAPPLIYISAVAFLPTIFYYVAPGPSWRLSCLLPILHLHPAAEKFRKSPFVPFPPPFAKPQALGYSHLPQDHSTHVITKPPKLAINTPHAPIRRRWHTLTSSNCADIL